MNAATGAFDTLIEKAWNDGNFKRELVDDPKRVIEREFGISLPQNIDFKVHETTGRTVHLVLPPAPMSIPSDLTDEDLGAIASTRHGGSNGKASSGCGDGTRGICTLMLCSLNIEP